MPMLDTQEEQKLTITNLLNVGTGAYRETQSKDSLKSNGRTCLIMSKTGLTQQYFAGAPSCIASVASPKMRATG